MKALQPRLYPDPQDIPFRYCPVCGSCVYPPKYRCSRCERRQL